ncbi:MAG: hypothetical protein KAR13_07290, partial [Desulfobulbaceae bacterium]|nr:hypothetical protein [Desulfobulbaceae bacterium]
QPTLHDLTRCLYDKWVYRILAANPTCMIDSCLHGAKHYWSQLELICCVAELLRREPGRSFT